MSRTASVFRFCNRCNGTGSVDSGGVTPWGEEIQVPCECRSIFKAADEQETIFDRDVRAIISGWMSDPACNPRSETVVQDIVSLCEKIALEMERQRHKRKGIS